MVNIDTMRKNLKDNKFMYISEYMTMLEETKFKNKCVKSLLLSELSKIDKNVMIKQGYPFHNIINNTGTDYEIKYLIISDIISSIMSSDCIEYNSKVCIQLQEIMGDIDKKHDLNPREILIKLRGYIRADFIDKMMFG